MNVPVPIRSTSTFSFVLLAMTVLFAGACSSASSSSGSGGSQGSGGMSSGTGGKSASGGSSGSGSGGSASGGSASGGTIGSGGSSSGGSGSGGVGSGGKTGSGGSASGGSATGGSASGGSTGSGGSATGGAATGGALGSGGAAGAGSGGTTGGGGAGSGSSDCPSGAYFCSGFEDATLPSALVYKVNAAPGDWSRDFALDTAVHHGGKQSLRVKSSSESGTSGSSYKMLAVPAATAFWARFYMQSEMDIGGLEHNAFASASGSDDPNDGLSCEFAEDVGLAFNTKDDDRWPMGYGRTSSGGTMPYSLPKNAWHCIEISYDGAGKVQQLFVEGMQIINATNYPSGTAMFKEFKFGFMEFHGPPRKIWYDDIVVSPTRSPCPPN
jgi:hypothetical protein